MHRNLFLLCCVFSIGFCTFEPSVTTTFISVGSDSIYSVITDDTYVYFGAESRLFKVRISDDVVVATIDLEGSERSPRSAVRDGTIGYFSCQTDPSIIVKVQISKS